MGREKELIAENMKLKSELNGLKKSANIMELYKKLTSIEAWIRGLGSNTEVLDIRYPLEMFEDIEKIIIELATKGE